jgi:uncharacterized repeat protein (TIGR01451 family)
MTETDVTETATIEPIVSEPATAQPTALQTAPPEPEDDLLISSPEAESEIGGVISILGTVRVDGMRGYTLEFGAGENPVQWIPILDLRSIVVNNGRLAFWDTTRIPDGIYTLRLRAVMSGQQQNYVDYYVRGIAVANAPRTLTPVPTALPTATPTATPLPTATPTPEPTVALDDGVSAYLYVTQMDQSDPLCLGSQQRYGIWVSNVSMITVNDVVITNTLPTDCDAVMAQSTGGGEYDEEAGTVVWRLGDLRPGEARKVEIQVDVPSWMQVGKWLTNRVDVTSSQVPHVSKEEQSLVSECPWLAETAAALNLPLPTSASTPTGTPSPAVAQGKPTLLPTATVMALEVPVEAVGQGLDLLTLMVAVMMVVLLAVTGVLIYRRVIKRM